MPFLLKKIAGDLVMPLGFSLALIAIGTVLLWIDRWRRLAKCLIAAGCGLLLIFSNPLVGYDLTHHLEAQYSPLNTQRLAGSLAFHSPGSSGAGKADVDRLSLKPVIVVLGGGASDDPLLPEADRLTSSSALRVVAAVEIYRELATPSSLVSVTNQAKTDQSARAVEPRLILSGGPTYNSEPEALPMRALAESLGVPVGNILLEIHSDDTASEAKDLLPVLGHKPFILVTSAIQMSRAMALFQHQGMRPIAAPANFAGQKNTESFVIKLLPSVVALRDSTIAMHEQIGMLWERLRGQL